MAQVDKKENTPKDLKRLSRYFNEPDRINSANCFSAAVKSWERTLTGRIDL
jgi:hypothetical protein